MASFLSEIGVRFIVDDISGLRAGMSTVRRQAALTASSMVRMNSTVGDVGNLQKFNQAVRQVGFSVGILGNQLTNLGFRMGAFVSAPIIGAGAAIIKTGADFEREMTKIETLVGVNAERVEGWRNEILEIAPALGALPTDLAESMFFITSAGIRDTTEAMDALTTSAQLSAIGMGDIASIGNAVTSIMFTFGLSAEEAGDQLLTTVREGKVEADTLAQSMGRVIPISEQLGVSFAETGAIIATFTRTGVPAEVAVTALRSVLTSIQKPTQQARDALQEYGLTIEDVRENIAEHGLAATLIDLVDAFGDNNEAIARVFGNVRGLSAILAVTGEQSENYRIILDSITDSAGNMDQAFERVGDTAAFQFARTQAAINVVAQEMAVVLLPLVNDVLDRIVALSTSMREFVVDNRDVVEFIAPILAVVAIIPVLTFVVGAFISTVGGAIVLVTNFVAALIAFNPVVLAAVSAVVALSTAFATMSAIFFANIRGIAEKMGLDFRDIAQRAATWGANIIISLANGMLSAIVHVINAMTAIARIITGLLQAQSPPKLLPHLDDWGTAAMQSWLDGWALADFDVFDSIANKVEGFMRALGSAEGAEGTDIASGIIGARSVIGQAVEEFRTLGEVSQATMDAIADSVGENTEAVMNYVGSLFDLQRANEAVEAAQERVNEVQEKFQAILDPLQSRLAEIRGQQEGNQRQDRRDELQRILVDPRSTEEVRERARLELEELSLLEQIAGIEMDRDAEVSAAEAALTAAEEQRDALEEQAEIHEKIIDFLTKQASLMGQTISPVTGGAGAGAGGGGGGAEDAISPIGDLDDIFGGGDDLAGGVSRTIEEMKKRLRDKGRGLATEGETIFGGFLTQIETGIADMLEAMNEASGEMQTAFADMFTIAFFEDNKLDEISEDIGKFTLRLQGLAKVPFDQIASGMERLDRAWGDMSDTFSISLPTIDLMGGLTNLLVVAFNNLVVIPLGLIAAQIHGLGSALEFAQPFIERAGEFWDEFVTSLTESEAGILAPIEWVNRLVRVLVTLFVGMVAFVVGLIFGFITSIIKFFKDLYTELVGESIVVDLIDEIKKQFDRVGDVVKAIHNFFFGPDGVVAKAKALYNALVGPNGTITGVVSDIVGAFEGIGTSIIAAIGDLSAAGSGLLAAFYNLGKDMVDQITEAIKDQNWVEFLKRELVKAAAAARDWIDRFFRGLVMGWGGNDDDSPDPPAGPITLGGGVGESVTGILNSPLVGHPAIGGASVASSPVVVTGSGSTFVLNMGGVTVNDQADIDRLAITIERRLMRSLR